MALATIATRAVSKNSEPLKAQDRQRKAWAANARTLKPSRSLVSRNWVNLVDQFLLTAFRFRTRDLLRMEPAKIRIPTLPSGNGYLYVHIPFCESLCPFCSFHRVQHCHAQARRYFHSLRQEILRYWEAGFRFTGAYFGGGTPTTEPEELVNTIQLVRKLFDLKEISVETNPRDLRPEILRALRDAGVTRLSVGVQSFDDRLLKEMDRFEKYGSGEGALQCLQRAAGIFSTLNVDLIFNLPHQDGLSLQRDIRIFRQTGANQISIYPLMTSRTVARRMKQHIGMPNRNRLREFYYTIVEQLRPEFAPTSAWCFTKQGNTSDEYIVEADYYVGVGSGAFSYVEGNLYATTFCLDTYEKRIAQGLTGITAQNHFSASDQMRYSLLVKMFGLQLDRRWALARHGPKFFRKVSGELRTLEWLGAATRGPNGWRVTDRGMYWLMLMMCAFFESVNNYREAMRASTFSNIRENLAK